MRTLALFAAILWALGCSLAYPCPKSLRAYLAVSLFANIGTEATNYAFGETAFAYAICYAVFTAANLAAALYVARDCLARRWHAWAGVGAATLIVLRAYGGIAKPLHFYDWFYLVEGAALALAGTSLVFSSAHLKAKSIYLTLSFLWLSQCVFRLGFAISWVPGGVWDKLNEVLPTVFICGALGWIGIQLLEKRTITTQ